jgi:hypothetical protein
VCHAWEVSTAAKSKSAVKSELITLVNYLALQLSAEDIDTFREMFILSEISSPLQHFLFCCDHFEFAISSCDASFAKESVFVEIFTRRIQKRMP